LKKFDKDKEMQIMVLDSLIADFFATTTRQIIFSNFEYLANEYVNEAKPFTKEVIKQTYMDMIDKYQGMPSKTKKMYEKAPYAYSLSTIFRISHFYMGNFYVYKYAVGQIVAIITADAIVKGNKNTIENYFRFLKSGGSKSPLETIKILGIDLTKDEPYIRAKEILDS